MSEYRDRILGFGALTRKGTSEKRVISRDDDGTPAGMQTEHWDDHVDAVAFHPTIRAKAKLIGDDDEG